MSNFKRENRYVVFKRKNLSHAQSKVLHSIESELYPDGNVKECLVVEHDWPCYDAAWNMIVKLSEGEFSDPYAEITQLRERVKELEFKGSLAYSEETGFIDLSKFALEQKIEAIERFVLPYKQGVTKEYVKGGYGSLVLKAAQAEIEQLRKEQDDEKTKS